MTPDISTRTSLHLHTSNLLETLVRGLAEVTRAPLATPFAAETIVVQSQGMARWLRLELARLHGVCANWEFPFPKAFVGRVFREVLPEMPEESPDEPDVMTWKIMRALPPLLDQPGFEPLRRYLDGHTDARKLAQLAGKIAHLFDQYLSFRPAWMEDWGAGRGGDWQARLWRAVTGAEPPAHAAALRHEFEAAFSQPEARFPKLPERVSIFGISALPPFHVELFAVLARRIPVHLFLLQPSQEYWGDITSSREEERILRQANRPETEAFALHLEAGNRLLSSLGYLGRDFLKVLLGVGDWKPSEAFSDPGEASLLACIQSDILHLRDRGSGILPVRVSLDACPTSISPEDDSIQIHSCHSPLREMEILHDHFLDWFERDPQLAPRDIVVMMPDIETYAPFVQAVFGSPEEEAKRIPFSLADRGARRQSQVVETFLHLLNLPATRMGAATVLAPLEARPVRDRFQLAEADVELIRGWIEQARIRWGIDAAHRARLELPALPADTWREGLRRLLLGYAMAGRGERMFEGVLPFDAMEGSAADVLGHFAEYVERLFATVESLAAPRGLDDWAARLAGLLDEFFLSDEESERELRIIRAALDDLRRCQRLSGFDLPVEIAVVLEHLAPRLEEDRFASGFLTGGVTFCGLKPMRSIPFKVICLVGMNDNAFPRPVGQLSFDLMAQAPWLGDRSSREDDRYLFLETVLSARQRLYISYVGQSIRDNSAAPPSVLVSELLDYVAQGFELAQSEGFDRTEASNPHPLTPALSPSEGERENVAQPTSLGPRSTESRQDSPNAPPDLLPLPRSGGEGRGEGADSVPTTRLLAHLVTRHRLQAFSEAYFDRRDPRLFSYSAENGRASEAAGKARTLGAPFLSRPLPPPEAEFCALTLEDLTAFLCNPAKFLLNRRFNIFLRVTGGELDEREIFHLNALEHYQLKQSLLEKKLAAPSSSPDLVVVQAAGGLPLGKVGEAGFHAARAETDRFWRAIEPHHPGHALAPLDLDLALGGFRLTGRVGQMTPSGLLSFRCASLKPADLLRHWVRHLAANAIHPGTSSVLVGEDKERALAACDDADARLRDLLDFYWRGLSTAQKFFPKSSLAFAEAARRQEAGGTAKTPPIVHARRAWEGNELNGTEGEREDPHFELCFRHADPLDAEFERLATAIFGPILEHEVRS